MLPAFLVLQIEPRGALGDRARANVNELVRTYQDKSTSSNDDGALLFLGTGVDLVLDGTN
jgi:hypothetical protein